MAELEIIRHNDILFRDLLRAVAVKGVAWPYPLESQVKWIVENMQPNDLHVFLKDKGEDKAYLTLSPVTAIVNGVETPFMGVGCVCSVVHGVGFGKQLLGRVNKWLTENDQRGLLFCKRDLTEFYMKNHWRVIDPSTVVFYTKLDGVYTMSYNCERVKKLEYSDRSF